MTNQQIVESNCIIRNTMDGEVNIHVPDLVKEKLNKLSSVLGLSSQQIAKEFIIIR